MDGNVRVYSFPYRWSLFALVLSLVSLVILLWHTWLYSYWSFHQVHQFLSLVLLVYQKHHWLYYVYSVLFSALNFYQPHEPDYLLLCSLDYLLHLDCYLLWNLTQTVSAHLFKFFLVCRNHCWCYYKDQIPSAYSHVHYLETSNYFLSSFKTKFLFLPFLMILILWLKNHQVYISLEVI